MVYRLPKANFWARLTWGCRCCKAALAGTGLYEEGQARKHQLPGQPKQARRNHHQRQYRPTAKAQPAE